VEKQVSSNSRLRFTDRTVVITGSGTGIGQAIARKFAENGANIVIMGRRKEPLDQTAGILKQIISSSGSTGRLGVFPGVDVADESGINSMFQSVRKQFGGVDIIVNNAGISGPVKTFTNASVKEFREAVAIHLTGTYWTSVASLSAMRRGSKIITIATFLQRKIDLSRDHTDLERLIPLLRAPRTVLQKH
jgi:NAD(P)-dependent dehydrogenase (short-subunit alcohol dehydrogenase family)